MKNKTVHIIFFGLFLNMAVKAQNPIVQNILNDADIDSLTCFVQQLTGEKPVIISGSQDTIWSRHKDHPGNEKAFQFTKEKFLSYGLQVDSLQFSITGKNLFGIKTGTMFPGKKYILGAHYDNVGAAIAPGADDNASGSATVIEAARIFSAYNFPFTIVFALWDEEEQGLIGSNAYASSTNDSILGYINIDMLGWDGNNDSLADLHVRPVGNSIQLGNKAIQVNTLYAIGLGLHIVNPGTGATDHATFWNNNFTAIGINEEYDGDFNPYWHTQADSLGQLNLPFFMKCSKLAYATLAECALDSLLSLGILDKLKHQSMLIYPNPASDYLNVEFPDTYQINPVFHITDILGVAYPITPLNNQGRYTIDLRRFQSGLYLLTVKVGKYSNSTIIIKN